MYVYLCVGIIYDRNNVSTCSSTKYPLRITVAYSDLHHIISTVPGAVIK